MSDPETARLLQAAARAQADGAHDRFDATIAEVLKRDPEQPAALNALGMRELAAQRFAEAAALFERAAAADPGAPALWVNLAPARRGAGDAEGEQASLARVLEIDQRHLTANIRLAELHERQEEPGKAAFRWNAVLAIAQALPERPPALDPLLAHARAYVETQGRAFGETVDNGLADARAAIPASERRRIDACVDAMLGRRRIYHNECAGLHVPFLPADEFFDRAHFPWLDEIEVLTGAIRAEFEAMRDEGLSGFSPYVEMESGVPDNKWTPLDHSLDWSALHLWRHGERIDEPCRRCPQTAAALAAMPLARVPRRMPTAFFSVLRPRTHLPAHHGVSNARAIIHLPLIVPPGCRFRVGGETREWRVGEAWAFDDTIEHEAWNDSGELRAILIFDTWNPHLTEAERHLLTAFFDASDASGFALEGSALGD